MAISKEAEQACYDAFNAAFLADTGAGGLNNATQVAGAYTSAAYCLGNATDVPSRLMRQGDPQRTEDVPRIVWEGTTTEELDTPANARVQMLVRLHHHTNRETPDGFGSQDPVAIRSRQVFHRGALTASGGWNFSTLVRKRGFQAPPSGKVQHYIVEYAVVMSAGSAGGF